MDRFAILKVLINLAAGSLSIQHKCKGPSSTVNTACASGQTCIGEAFTAIQRGDADVMVAGAAEDSLQPFILSGFYKIGVLNAEDNGNPEGASRPFDEDRKGFVVGEGAGALVLEELEHALSRKAKIYAELRGYGCAVEAEHLTRPSEDGDGTYRAMQEAISQGGLTPQDIDQISAHGTSTLEGDYAEAIAIMRLFRMPGPVITASSGNIGHLLGAAGAVQAAFTVLSVRNDEIPPMLNLKKPVSLYSGKIVPRYAKSLIKHKVKAALSNAFGFGGVSTSLLFTKYTGDK
jgi:3-oxoacyl-[acyl-carrier-protein] synthase II